MAPSRIANATRAAQAREIFLPIVIVFIFVLY
jgi:hypothetical protein